jgi:hypothetical protein
MEYSNIPNPFGTEEPLLRFLGEFRTIFNHPFNQLIFCSIVKHKPKYIRMSV